MQWNHEVDRSLVSQVQLMRYDRIIFEAEHERNGFEFERCLRRTIAKINGIAPADSKLICMNPNSESSGWTNCDTQWGRK